ncbi:MAG: 50S ribosomal protein L17 [Candidatus Moranbacteria bacterium]|nr:50S ribosomal protein L17 [Candidatus Moranbacteria bacterium]
MKHKIQGRKFGRPRRQRIALMRTLLGSLIMKERITTTEAKAKEVKNVIDGIVNKAKKAQSTFEIVRKLEGKVPQMAIKKLSDDEFREKFDGRDSGYTRVVKTVARKSDRAAMAIIEFV